MYTLINAHALPTRKKRTEEINFFCVSLLINIGEDIETKWESICLIHSIAKVPQIIVYLL